MKYLTEKQLYTIGFIISGLLGFGFAWFLYGAIVDPRSVDWIMSRGGDAMQHLIGWEFFRHDAWRFPIGVMNNYGYPVGIPLTYTDSIPLFAIFFKLFRSILPQPFHYFGLWVYVCTILQGMFGFVVFKSRIRSVLVSILGASLLILTPVMLFRMGGHSALGAHWLILWGLWLVIREKRAGIVHWSVLLIIGLLVHPYLFFMNGGLLVADLAKQAFVDKTLKWIKAVGILVLHATIILLVGWIVGIFYADNIAAPGYGAFSMNLNALINPLDWSVLLKKLPLGQYQYEGFNYLGLGALLLTVLAGYSLLMHESIKQILRRWWPLLGIALILGVISISHVVMVNGYNIWNAPMPRWLDEHILGIIRSSGRLFWPVDYLIIIASVLLLARRGKQPVLVGIMLFAVLLQAYDIHAKLRDLRHDYAKTDYITPLVSSYWQDVATKYKHISFIPTYTEDTYGPIAWFAATNHMTLNTGYFAHFAIKDDFAHVDAQITQLKDGMVDRDTLYIFPREYEEYLNRIDQKTHILTQVDSYMILNPFLREHVGDVTIPEVK